MVPDKIYDKRLPCKIAGIGKLAVKSDAAHEPLHKQVY